MQSSFSGFMDGFSNGNSRCDRSLGYVATSPGGARYLHTGIRCTGTLLLPNSSANPASANVDWSGDNDEYLPAEITMGGWHGCARLRNGGVRCWGFRPMLGDGIPVSQAPSGFAGPTEVVGINDATAISAGSLHTCALVSSGQVECWGYNLAGEIGGGPLDAYEPTPRMIYPGPLNPVGMRNFTAIASGSHHTCGLQMGGEVYCWGSNTSGQLGTEVSSGVPGYPVRVENLAPAIAITASSGSLLSNSGGGDHTCALLATGQVKCWGANYYGQLGNGTTSSKTDRQSTPVSVVFPP